MKPGKHVEDDRDLGYVLGWFCAISLLIGLIVVGVSWSGGAMRKAFQAIVLPVVLLICAIPLFLSVDNISPRGAIVLLSLLVAEVAFVPVVTLRLLRGLPWPVDRPRPDRLTVRLSPSQSPSGRSVGHTNVGLGSPGFRPQLTTGTLTGPDGELPARRGRAGKCKTCGRIWDLDDAEQVWFDWEQVDAYHYYCRDCYVTSRDPYFFKGLLVDGSGEAIVDQKDHRRFGP